VVPKFSYALLLHILTWQTVEADSSMEAEDFLRQQLDYFEHYEQLLDPSKFQDDQPVVGILTMEPWDPRMRTEDFTHPHFVWEHNVNFIHYAGTWAVPIKFDISEEDLAALLPQINGVYFTGGATPLIDEEGNQSIYYKTAKRIFEYSKQ
jgi:hypothetical protein